MTIWVWAVVVVMWVQGIVIGVLVWRLRRAQAFLTAMAYESEASLRRAEKALALLDRAKKREAPAEALGGFTVLGGCHC